MAIIWDNNRFTCKDFCEGRCCQILKVKNRENDNKWYLCNVYGSVDGSKEDIFFSNIKGTVVNHIDYAWFIGGDFNVVR